MRDRVGRWPRRKYRWGLDKVRAAKNNIRKFGYQSIGTFTEDDLDELITKQDGLCANPFCGCDLRSDFIELDHKQPLSLNGSNTADNLQFLCPPCNKRKYSRSYAEWLSYEKDLHSF